MADTTRVPLTSGLWTEIAAGPATGYISNEEGPNFRLAEAATGADPVGVLGHTISRNDVVGYHFDLQAGQSVYGRPTSNSTQATVTSSV